MVCFLILHYMVTNETEKCVDSILNNVKGDKHILIVDNYSPNDSYNLLSKYYEKNDCVTIIKNVKNDGFAKGNNFGYVYAKTYLKPDFICCMNNDMEIKQADFINQIYDIYNKTHFYVLGPDIYSVATQTHQNPELKTMRTYDEVCKQYSKFQRKQGKVVVFYIKGFAKNIKILRKVYYSIKKKFRYQSDEWKQEKYNTALHGSCLIFSPEYLTIKENAFFSGTRFYCEAQILDYECRRDHMLTVYSPKLWLFHYEDVATDAVFKKYAKKAIFVNECMLDSLKAFKKLMEKDMQKNLE